MNLNSSVTWVKIFNHIFLIWSISPAELEDKATSLLLKVIDLLRAFQVDYVIATDLNVMLLNERDTLLHRVQYKHDVDE